MFSCVQVFCPQLIVFGFKGSGIMLGPLSLHVWWFIFGPVAGELCSTLFSGSTLLPRIDLLPVHDERAAEEQGRLNVLCSSPSFLAFVSDCSCLRLLWRSSARSFGLSSSRTSWSTFLVSGSCLLLCWRSEASLR